MKKQSTFLVIKHLEDNRKKNNGQPIVAALFKNSDHYNPIVTESNKREIKQFGDDGKEEYQKDSYLRHAEWLCMNHIIENNIDTKDMTLYITSSPCDKCATRISKEFPDLKVEYLFDKKESTHTLFKKNKNVTKYIPNCTGKELASLSIQEIHWTESNQTNNAKTLDKQK